MDEDMLTALIVIVVVVAVLIVRIVGAFSMLYAARQKGYADKSNRDGKEGNIFAICFLFGMIGYLYVIALPDKILHIQNQQILNGQGNNQTTKGNRRSTDDLQKYKDWLDYGVITQEEFDKKKEQILNM